MKKNVLLKLIITLLFIPGLMAVASETILLQNQIKPKRLNEPAFNSNHALVLDVFGRGGIYSLGYEYSASQQFSFGLGYSYMAIKANPALARSSITVQTFPIYANAYLPFGSHRPFFSAGVSLIQIQGTANLELNDIIGAISLKINDQTTTQVKVNQSIDNSVSVILPVPVIGAGYEIKYKSNSFLRFSYLAIYTDKMINWGGITMGVGL